MKAILFVLATLYASACAAQPCSVKRNPMKQALLWQEPARPAGGKLGERAPLAANEGYNLYAAEVTLLYQTLYHLDTRQTEALQSALGDYYSQHPGYKTADGVHALLKGRMKGILAEAQYRDWNGLKRYPEYEAAGAGRGFAGSSGWDY